MRGFVTSAAALAIALASPGVAATQIVNGSGQLTGATGVIVNGTSYDVQFVDGTCAALFGGCDSNSDFAFNSYDATIAAQALLDQVFVDGPAGNFDSDPSLTLGCDFSTLCYVDIPWGYDASQNIVAITRAINTNNFDSVGSWSFDSRYPPNTSGGPQDVFARFTLSPVTPAVPEPSTWAMMLIGFGAIGFAARRRRALAACDFLPSISKGFEHA
jgi:hypothetical protein